jgi:glycine C-acetyltransferase
MQGNEFRERLRRATEALEAAGLLKRERVIGTAQGPVITLSSGQEMINLCANNYLGLANHPAVLKAAHDGLTRYGYGMASVRFICGTQTVHRDLEERLSAYLGMDDTILYSSCFDANGGLFETLLDEKDAVISDALNHASIIDGIRLCKARRLRYANNDMGELTGAQGFAGCARAADCHRRRIFHGRVDRAPGRNLRSRRPLRCVGHGR